MNSHLTMDYASKTPEYFDGARSDIVAMLPKSSTASIIEIGCGNGSTGAIAKDQGKCGRYVGVDVDETAADIARASLDVVVHGNVETLDFLSLDPPFDAAILSEVLEHLVDPWGLLSRLNDAMRPGALIFASSPNVANAQLMRQLLRNRFDYVAEGVMDRTHLRWFTSDTFKEMFETSGFETLSVGPLNQPSFKWRALNALTANQFAHLASSQIKYCGRKPSG